MSETIQFIQISPEDLSKRISNEVSKSMEKFVQSRLTDKIEWLTKTEASEALKVSERTVDRKVKSGILRQYGIDGSKDKRFKRSDVDALLIELK